MMLTDLGELGRRRSDDPHPDPDPVEEAAEGSSGLLMMPDESEFSGNSATILAELIDALRDDPPSQIG
jgi:hypothetical protein